MIKRIGGFIIFGLIMFAIAGWVNSFQTQEFAGEMALDVPQQDAQIPQITFLGTGPGTFEVPPGYEFIVKFRGENTYTVAPGPTVEATYKERVWQVEDVPATGYAIYEDIIILGSVDPGCQVEYVQIDDDVDDRRNGFFINGELVHVTEQGMVSYGGFVAETAGELSFGAEDSVGLIYNICAEVQPSPTPTSTDTPVATETPTNTPEPPTETPTGEPPTETPTGDPPTETPTGDPPTETPTGDPPTETPTGMPPTETPTGMPPTETPTPTVTATDSSPQPTITPTKKPWREKACLRINFEISGDEARRGLYVVQEVGGRVYVEWYALDGWQDSGWFQDLDITYPSVYVQVLYYSGPDAEPVVMKILNPAPGTEYGWLGRGMCHALEVGWP